jgi:hypothetical protein
MAYSGCPMFGSYGLSGAGGMGLFYLNVILAALIFAGIFWGIYYLLIKEKTATKTHARKRK